MQLNNSTYTPWNPRVHSTNTPILITGSRLTQACLEQQAQRDHKVTWWATGSMVLLTVLTLAVTLGLFMSDKI